ncbi:hypothetical protein N4T20_20185 [Flavobacterium sp. TR2]|uniref:hypothetical protein n=1 Tax=Flavobacterium sp. TR2 TaxID=2977321 RepID=UPI0021B0AA28|nr:hypothetical protein [Flavobacterium sp. TR2]UWY28027.1 hypothetical protein N4T20_20185 [Flavobacterium sp. TR2]
MAIRLVVMDECVNKTFKFLLMVCFISFLSSKVGAQTKIGGAPRASNPNAYLELGDANATKGFLMPRVALSSTKEATPLMAHVAGMQVYNTTTVNDVTPGVYYNDGTKWILFSSQIGQSSFDAGNGLTKSGQTLKLGGNLTEPVTIGTTDSNTLALSGLQEAKTADHILAIDPATGVIRQISSNNLSNKMLQQKIVATNGQIIFTTPSVINSLDKIQVFRNGAEIEFTAKKGENQISLVLYPDTNGGCLAGDEVKIYQWE